MTDVSEVIERLFREYLEPPTETVASAPLAAGVGVNQSPITLTPGHLSPDEERILAPGIEVEVEYELMRAGTYNANTKELAVQRGWKGTDRATHVAGSIFRIPGRWTRQSAFEAVADAIERLWPPLSIKRGVRVTSAVMRAPSIRTVEVLEVIDTATGLRGSGEVQRDHPTYKPRPALFFNPDTYTFGNPYAVLGEAPARPTALDETLEIPDLWIPIVLADAAAQLVAGVDLDAQSQEYITEQLAAQNFPVRSGATVLQGLITFKEYLVRQERERLMADRVLSGTVTQTVYSQRF